MMAKSKNAPAVALTVPCHWEKSIINAIVKNNSNPNNIPVKEIYGALADGGPLGHGRSPESVTQLTAKSAIEFREFLYRKKIDFTYLLNAPFEISQLKNNQVGLDTYLDWVFNRLCPDSLTISSSVLADYVRTKNSAIPIHISTIAGVKSPEDILTFLGSSPCRVVPHHDCGKRWKMLQGIIDYCKKGSMDVEMLATESCLFNCQRRKMHYEHLARKNKDGVFHSNCNTRKLNYPREFLLSGGFIRPEDMKLFIGMGVSHFKITGRSKSAKWLPEVTDAYQRQSYGGNFVRLLGIDPTIEAEDWIYIDNKALDGFLEGYPQTENYEDEKKYCDWWIISLYEKKKFFLSDGSEYTIKNNELILKKVGSRAAKVLQRELL